MNKILRIIFILQTLRSFSKSPDQNKFFECFSDSNWDEEVALCWYIGEDHNLPIILARPTQLNTAILLQAIITPKQQQEISRRGVEENWRISHDLAFFFSFHFFVSPLSLFADKNLKKQFFRQIIVIQKIWMQFFLEIIYTIKSESEIGSRILLKSCLS